MSNIIGTLILYLLLRFVNFYYISLMKSYFLVFFSLLFSLNAYTQNFEGAWQLIALNNIKVENRKVIKIVCDGYFTLGSKDLSENSFLGAAGGEYKLIGNDLFENRDFDTYNKAKIGNEIPYKLIWKSPDTLIIKTSNENKVWKRLKPSKQDFSGNYVITGRQKEDEIRQVVPGERRTIKILNDGRFQWVAFDSGKKQFYASGGGEYIANDGIYTEKIKFFSKDKSRVGTELDFQYQIKDKLWHHKGKSSKGKPIYEIWSPFTLAYKF